MTRVLITGGAGFVGTNLVAQLHRSGGYELTVLDNESLGSRDHLAGYDHRFIHADIADEQALRQALAGMDVVVHLAADTRVVDSIDNPVHNFTTNVVGTFNLLRHARDAGVKRVVNASTGGAILGEVPPPVHEAMAANPTSPYGASKLAAEGYCSAFNAAYGLSTVSLRFSNIYGPGSWHKGSVVAHFFKAILAGKEVVIYGDGSQTRDYLFVGDLAAGIESAMRSEATGAIQLASGRPTDLNTLLDLMQQVVGPDHPIRRRYAEFRAGEIRNTWCDIAKARDLLGFDPGTPLEHGLRTTWQWFQRAYA